MKNMARIVLRGLALVLAIGAGFGVYAAGLAVFGATTFAIHASTGWMMLLVGMLMFVASLVVRGDRRLPALAAVVLLLLMMQPVLALAPVFRVDTPVISALHPVSGFAILVLAYTIWRRSAAVS